MKMGRVNCVPCLHSPWQVKTSWTPLRVLAKWAMTTNTAFTTQTVLCKAPYCLALLYYIHVQHENSLPFTYNLTSVCNELAEVLHVHHVYTTSLPNLNCRWNHEIGSLTIPLYLLKRLVNYRSCLLDGSGTLPSVGSQRLFSVCLVAGFSLLFNVGSKQG